MYLCITYGVVIIKVLSCNKRVISIKYSHIVFFLIPANTRRKGNPKTSIVYRGAPTHIYICHTLPLDNLKIHIHIALPYITWGLIQDLKNRKKNEIPIENKTVSGIPKLRRISPQSFVLRKYKISSSEIPVKDCERKILLVSQHTRFEVLQKKEQLCIR